MSDETVSAMMPVHSGIDPAHMAEAAKSILMQSRAVDEIVVVEDGPLNVAHHDVLDRLKSEHPRVVCVALKTNQGAGVANQAGLEAASGHWIMKADADDINVPHRLATQLVAAVSSNADVCGAAMHEFSRTPTYVVATRSAPVSPRAVELRARWNNPVNHPTALYRRDQAIAVGGYPPWRHMQDYGLFARLLGAGCTIINVPEALVLFRRDDVSSRRSGVQFWPLEKALQQELLRLELISPRMAWFNLVWRSCFRLLPHSVVEQVSRRVLARAG